MKLPARLFMTFFFSLFLASLSLARPMSCSKNQITKNVFNFEIENTYSIYFAGLALSCGLRCQTNLTCQEDCQHREALIKTTNFMVEKHGDEILKCHSIKNTVALFQKN